MASRQKAHRSSFTTATARLKQDYLRLIKDPVPYVAAVPLPHNILEWRYVVTGPEDTPYEGGVYQGRLVFPQDFPFKPPSIYMITPNGRFKVNTRLCLSISDFHPDTWNPAWTVSSILTGLVSFMVESTPTKGSVETTTATKRQLAQDSVRFNLADETFRTLFPETANYLREAEEREKVSDKENEKENEKRENSSTTDEGKGDDENIEAASIGAHFLNVFVFLGVAAFAFTVKCVLGSIK